MPVTVDPYGFSSVTVEARAGKSPRKHIWLSMGIQGLGRFPFGGTNADRITFISHAVR